MTDKESNYCIDEICIGQNFEEAKKALEDKKFEKWDEVDYAKVEDKVLFYKVNKELTNNDEDHIIVIGESSDKVVWIYATW